MTRRPCVWKIEGKVLASCNCPRAYSRCIRWVRWDEEHENYSEGHGGWGWRDPARVRVVLAARAVSS
jgi:hypothetical protein